jgi:3-phosphoshikimate 1-carboxyvinyltransferase
MGATVLGQQGGRLAPLTICGGSLRGIDYALPIASAQLKSAILLAGLYAEDPTTVHEPWPARDHTERMLRARGVRIEAQKGVVTLYPGSKLARLDVAVPGDFSSAAFLIAAACLVPHSEIALEKVDINPTRTGFLEVLRAMGGDVVADNQRETDGEPVADLVVRGRAAGERPHLRGVEVGGELVPRMIDELPILAVVATQAEGETVVRNAAELRVKETDRIAAIVAELTKLGARIAERPDGFVVQGPTKLQGARVDSHNDHRLAMSLAVAGLVAGGEIIVEGAECIGDSFPEFAATLARLTGCGDEQLHV